MAEKINIIGGGLSGTLMAIYLAKRGFEINLFEHRRDALTKKTKICKSSPPHPKYSPRAGGGAILWGVGAIIK